MKEPSCSFFLVLFSPRCLPLFTTFSTFSTLSQLPLSGPFVAFVGLLHMTLLSWLAAVNPPPSFFLYDFLNWARICFPRFFPPLPRRLWFHFGWLLVPFVGACVCWVALDKVMTHPQVRPECRQWCWWWWWRWLSNLPRGWGWAPGFSCCQQSILPIGIGL